MIEEETITPTEEWEIIPRMSRTIPFGYERDPEDDELLVPVILELEALKKAKAHIKKGYSYRETAKWLSEVTGRSISHMGLRKRITNDRKNSGRLRGLKLQAQRIEALIKRAEKAAAKTGARISKQHGDSAG